MTSIDVLIPSRQRASLLDRAVQSLWQRWKSVEEVNFLVAVDSDDPEINTYREIFRTKDLHIWPGEVRPGYSQLHSYYNVLASGGSGDWLLIWNDDAMMLTEGWDEVIATQDHTVPNVLNFMGQLNTFPAVSRPFYAVLGHLSLQCHTDTWIHEVARAARIEKPLMGAIQIDHVRERIDDETKRATQAAYAHTSPKFNTPEMQRLREIDVRRLMEAMK